MRSMINVLFIDTSVTGGGSCESLYQHLRAIDRGRLRPIVVFLNENRFVPLVEGLDIPVYVLTDRLYSEQASRFAHWLAASIRRKALRLNKLVPSAYLKVARLIHKPLVDALTRIVRSHSIDIIHLNVQIYRDLFGVFLAERTRVPCISHLRSTDPMTGAQFDRLMAGYANGAVSAYIANSEMTWRSWEAKGIDATKTHLVYNGLPTHEIPAMDIRKMWGIDDATFIVGCVAPLRNRAKVDETLVRGFAKFLGRCSGTALLVVGDGPLRGILEKEAVALGINGHVIFTGFQEHTKEIIAGLDVSLVINYHDSFSRVALETMQACTPLVATDVGGIREIVNPGENGLLIDYGDEEAFADVMERLLVDNELRAELVENGSRTIRERFSIERYASEVERVYLSLVGEEVALSEAKDAVS